MNSKIKTKSVLAVEVYLKVTTVGLTSTIFLGLERGVRERYIICSIVTSIIYHILKSARENVKSNQEGQLWSDDQGTLDTPILNCDYVRKDRVFKAGTLAIASKKGIREVL